MRRSSVLMTLPLSSVVLAGRRDQHAPALLRARTDRTRWKIADVRRLAALAIVAALAAAGCGGGSDAEETTTTSTALTSTTAPAGGGASFTVTAADNGARFTLEPGDEVIVQLPLGAEGDPDWIVAAEPDADVLAGGDSMRFVPSEPGSVAGYWEFTFVATGPGLTTVTLSRGPLSEDTDSLFFTVGVAEPSSSN